VSTHPKGNAFEMVVDVVMEDVVLSVEEEGKPSCVQLIQTELQTLAMAVHHVDLRGLARLQMAAIKRTITGPVLKRCIKAHVNNEEQLKDMMLMILDKESDKLDEKLEKQMKDQVYKDPEVAFFFAILVLDYMLGPMKMSKSQCEKFSSQLVVRAGNLNRRTMDFFSAKVYAYFGRLLNDNEVIRNDLLAIYRTACLRRDVSTQATVLNLILRNYIQYNLFDQAAQFVSKTSFPETRTNAEYARYLFYIGRMKCIQLQYSEAHSKLMQAIRKAPQGTNKATAFKVLAWKFALTVELLMGEIPLRQHFLQPEFRRYLVPYEDVTQAVRGGSIPQFESVVNKYKTLFKADGTLTLIMRLRYNVIKTGLRKINVSYSRISLEDICAKLGLESVEDAAGICGKAIADGVINARLDYDNNHLLSKDVQDVYSTAEPQNQLNKRIAFCLQLHADCVKSMEYPEKKRETDESADPNADAKEREEALKEAEEDDIDML